MDLFLGTILTAICPVLFTAPMVYMIPNPIRLHKIAD